MGTALNLRRIRVFSWMWLVLGLAPAMLPYWAHGQTPVPSHLWSKRFGSTSVYNGNEVAVDSSGNVVVTGYFSGTVDFGGGNLTSAGSFDIFLLKLAVKRRGQLISELPSGSFIAQ